jgi:hypothetical protein
MIASALTGQNEQLLTKLSVSLVQEPDLPKFVEHVALLGKLSLADNEPISSFSIPAQLIFREAQLRIAALNSDWPAYTSLDRRIIELLDISTGQTYHSDFLLVHFITSNLYLRSPIPFQEKLRRALSVAEMLSTGSVRKEFKDLIRGRLIGDLIMVVSSRMQTPDDLRFWMQLLQRANESLKQKIFQAFDRRHE